MESRTVVIAWGRSLQWLARAFLAARAWRVAVAASAKALVAAGLCVLAWGSAAGEPVAPGPMPVLALDTARSSADAWPVMRVWREPGTQTSVDQAWAQRDRFEPVVGRLPASNLGPHAGTTWIYVPVDVAADAPRSWMLHIDYALMHRVSVSRFDPSGRRVDLGELGAAVAHDQRPLRTRGLSWSVELEPGTRQHLLLRVVTPTAQLMNLHLQQPAALLESELRTQAYHGAMTGLWLFMMAYSLVSWWQRRQPVFLAYAGSLLSSWLFSLGIYSTGAQWLWPGSAWLSTHMTVLAPMLLAAANAQFFVAALDMKLHAPRTARLLHGLCLLALVGAVGVWGGWISYETGAKAGMVLGTAHLLIALPVAWRRYRQDDSSAGFVLAGGLVNLTGIVVLSLLLRGYLPVGFLTLHLAQFTHVSEMVCWLLALGARFEQLRQAAARARDENDALQALASTDGLTGLRNRRGLEAALEQGLRRCHGAGDGQARPLALFLLDLDGFKAINDRWGHEAGDKLLCKVAERLQQAVRPGDVVARLGGDEFVVLTERLHASGDATIVGRKLLKAFDQPFDLGQGREGRVGATIGCAVAPHQAQDSSALLRAADAAMYRGKQDGKRVLRMAA